jgi:hypothetical protein
MRRPRLSQKTRDGYGGDAPRTVAEGGNAALGGFARIVESDDAVAALLRPEVEDVMSLAPEAE